MSINNKLVFSVTRNDLLYDFAAKFDEVFRFCVNDKDVMSADTGVRMQEALGFDFSAETSPIIEILPAAELISSSLAQSPDDFSFYITLEDIALGIRRTILSKPVNEVTEVTKIKLNLADEHDLGFYRGYVVRCFISRNASAAQNSNVVWCKSQIVYQSEFIVKASVEEALFEISWTTFNDQDARKNLLFYIDWASHEVSNAPHYECFQVKANDDLKAQFKRLENNKHFGELCIRLIVDKIVVELAENTLRCCDLSNDPLDGSLHEKMNALFLSMNLDFRSEAERYQSGDKFECLMVLSNLTRTIQSSHKIASTLAAVKFGGYR